MKWPLFSDFKALIIILVIIVFIWPIVGCDRVVVTQPGTSSNLPTVEVSTAPPVATATLRSTCLIGPAIMGCDD